jgi:hypothetical protein
LQGRLVDAAHAAAYFVEHGVFPPERMPSRTITEWSKKSRVRMTETFLQLDYAPLFADLLKIPGMWTLTYPDNWEALVPMGKEFKRHLDVFRKRFKRAWGYDIVGLWKLEFQGRGAPHVHIFAPVPHGVASTAGRQRQAVGAGLPFQQWLSVVWPDIVGNPDPEHRRRHEVHGTHVSYQEGLKADDPRRLAVYFSAHGRYAAKEYQHVVPELWKEPGAGPGRFWGYWGLQRAVEVVELKPASAIAAARVLRRWAAAEARASLAAQVVREGGVRPEGGWYRRARRLRSNRGFTAVNDGAEFASQLARAVGVPVAESTADRRARLVASTGSIRPQRVLSQVSVG